MYKKKFLPLTLFALSIASVNAVELPKKYFLTTSIAESIAKAAIAECNEINVPVSVSVVNDQGRLIYFYRGEKTGSNSIHTSFRKAYTSATLKIPTSQLSQAPESSGFSQLGKMEDDILLLTGGLPLKHNGELVGAIGLSGAPNPIIEEDCGNKAINKVFK
jgi:uncharacterized protein GlcG (DUF336 family)